MKSPLLAFLSLAALGLAACSRPAERKDVVSLPAVAVTTARVEAATLPRVQLVAGTVRPVDRAGIAARIMGSVTRVPAALGARVAAGDVLVELSAAEIGARLDQARANLDQVDRELARETTLVNKGASSLESVRLLEDRRRAAAAAVAEATTFASYTTLTAPFAGVITRRSVEPGDLAATGAPLLELEGTDRFRAELPVPESLPSLEVGHALRVLIEGRSVEGRLAEFSPAGDPVTRTRLARIDLPAGTAVRSGEFVRVAWPAGTEDTLLIPASALTQFGQMEQVFVAEGPQARLRLVKTGGAIGDRVRILSGLNAGESVIIAPPATLRDGQPLKLQP